MADAPQPLPPHPLATWPDVAVMALYIITQAFAKRSDIEITSWANDTPDVDDGLGRPWGITLAQVREIITKGRDGALLQTYNGHKDPRESTVEDLTVLDSLLALATDQGDGNLILKTVEARRRVRRELYAIEDDMARLKDAGGTSAAA